MRCTTSTQQTARRAVGDGGHQRTFTQPQPAAIRMPAIAMIPEAISSVITRPCSFGGLRQYALRGGTISAPTKVDRISSTISGRWWVIPSCVRVDLFFTVEDDEDHPEGIQRGHKRPDQAGYHQVDMTVSHRASEDFVLTEEACGNQRQCGQRRAPPGSRRTPAESTYAGRPF